METHAVRSALDAILGPAGFDAHPPGPDDTRLLYDMAADEFARRFPHLVSDGWHGHVSCVDLVVDWSGGGFTSELEGDPLASVLRKAGRDDLADQCDADPSLGHLAAALNALFAGPG